MASQQEPSSYDRRCLTDSLESYVNSTIPAVSKCAVLFVRHLPEHAVGIKSFKSSSMYLSAHLALLFLSFLFIGIIILFTHFSWFPLAL